MAKVQMLFQMADLVTTSRIFMNGFTEPCSSFLTLSKLTNAQRSCKFSSYRFHSSKAFNPWISSVREVLVSAKPSSYLIRKAHYSTCSNMICGGIGIGSNKLMKDVRKHGSTLIPLFLIAVPHNRMHSSHANGKVEGITPAEYANVNTADEGGSTWVDLLKQTHQSVLDAAGHTFKEISDSFSPHVEQLWKTYPELGNVIVPLGGTLVGSILAWTVMPYVLKRVHKYTGESLTKVFGNLNRREVPYESSMWCALEDPAKYLILFMAFSQLGAVLNPSVYSYLPQAWRGAVVLSFIWFLYRWKTNVFALAMAKKPSALEQDRLLALDNLSSLGLMALGVVTFAEACGVAVQSILTVGGVGGVAAAFASRDILGNMFSGFSFQFSRPFTVGDYIKAGSIEGRVTEIRLTTTSLTNLENLPTVVPNSFFSNQVIVNTSRAKFRAIITKIPVKVENTDLFAVISQEIIAMLKMHKKVTLEYDAPYCYLSQLEESFGELTIGCNIIRMGRDERLATQQDILLHAARVIKQHGAQLGNIPR